MAHKPYLNVDVKDHEVGTKDTMFLVYRDDKKFGELRVSKGSVVWRGRNDQYGRRIGWKRFDKLMQVEGRRCETRKPRAKKTVRASKR